jgi:hypothetical protein
VLKREAHDELRLATLAGSERRNAAVQEIDLVSLDRHRDEIRGAHDVDDDRGTLSRSRGFGSLRHVLVRHGPPRSGETMLNDLNHLRSTIAAACPHAHPPRASSAYSVPLDRSPLGPSV